MQYSNKCKICGTSIITSNKVTMCEACGSDNISYSKILSREEKIANRCINIGLIVLGTLISFGLVFSIVHFCY